jgi:fatty acid desaturase
MDAASRTRFYDQHAGELKRALAAELPAEVLRELHRKRAWRHMAVAASLFALLGACGVILWRFANPLIWVPAALVEGIAIFNFTVLLHEVVHRNVAQGDHPALHAALNWLYALPTGISATQFTRWHLDHHAGLGSTEDDPKRHRLSPKRNARWLKALYFTPALFFIYFGAARRETATYPAPLRRRIAFERWAAIFLHLAVASALAVGGGWGAFLRVYAVPVFIVFPAAFAANRLGQHYAIMPEDPAGWSTRMRPSRMWDAAYLWSTYHLEHHYFPGVPFYNLRRLNGALVPFMDRRGLKERSLPELLWLYMARNKAPHTDWG